MKNTYQTIAVKLKTAAERHVKKNHPWVYEDSIIKESKPPKTGDTAIIFDRKKNKYIAVGIYDTHSPIRIKIFQAHEKVHIDDPWINTVIIKALKKRIPLIEDGINGYRLINGENDGLPGLIIDVYDEVVVMKIYSALWHRFLSAVTDSIIQIVKPNAIILRLSRNITSIMKDHGYHDGQLLHGNLPNEEVIIHEYGVEFNINVIEGHKTGYFLDHRHNRRQLGTLAKDKTVLDVFSYTGGFSMHALGGGAKHVTAVDISKQALSHAEHNASINGGTQRFETISGDAFEVMDRLIKNGKKYDIIIIDPPSFAKRQDEIDGALHSYERLAHLACKLITATGILIMASCSARVSKEAFFDTIEQVFDEHQLQFQRIEKTFHDIDHPISFPEGAYLKCGYYFC